MRIDGEVKTKSCSQCKGSGLISRKHLRTGKEIPTGCPVCDGYGFVMANQPLELKPLAVKI